MQIHNFQSEQYDVELFEEHLKDNATVMPEFNRPIENESKIVVKVVLNIPKYQFIHFVSKNRLRRMRWLFHRNYGQVQQILANESSQSSCLLCGISIGSTIYKYFKKLLKDKKFYSKDQERVLKQMTSIIDRTSQMSMEKLFCLLGDTESKSLGSKLSSYLRDYERMYEGYCSCLCREIDFNRKKKRNLFI